MIGECRYGFKCLLIHGLKCDYCGQSCLHPSDAAQRGRHMKECVAQHEKDMELSFAVARSIDKLCGICYEKVMSKNPPGEQRFGILPSCNHCYCLSCIRRWRQERQFDNKTIRACPECRVTSDFVCPSRYWVDNKEEKDKLIGSYKIALSKKPCRYYRSGEGQCPFGNKCFYLHALPDGTVVDVGPPRRISGAQGRVRTTAQVRNVLLALITIYFLLYTNLIIHSFVSRHYPSGSTSKNGKCNGWIWKTLWACLIRIPPPNSRFPIWMTIWGMMTSFSLIGIDCNIVPSPYTLIFQHAYSELISKTNITSQKINQSIII